MLRFGAFFEREKRLRHTAHEDEEGVRRREGPPARAQGEGAAREAVRGQAEQGVFRHEERLDALDDQLGGRRARAQVGARRRRRLPEQEPRGPLQRQPRREDDADRRGSALAGEQDRPGSDAERDFALQPPEPHVPGLSLSSFRSLIQKCCAC